jgi:hypothetical protein
MIVGDIMEKYFLDLDEKFLEREMVLESIIYENDLLYTFGPVMEELTDATVASSGTGSTDTDSAVDNMTKATDKSADLENNAEKRDENKNVEDKNDGVMSKMAKEFGGVMNELVKAIEDFIKRYIADFRVSISSLLSENANLEAELDKIMKGKEPNLKMKFKDYNYNDNFIQQASSELNKTVVEYSSNMRSISDIEREIHDTSSLTDERKKEIQSILKNSVGSEKPASGPYLEKPHITIARKLSLVPDNEVSNISLSDVKKYIVNKYKGLGNEGGEPQTYTLEGNTMRLDNAINFIKKFKSYVKILNSNNDELRKLSEDYKARCKLLSEIKMDDELVAAEKVCVERISHDINIIIGLSECLRLCITERANSCEIFIKKAYNQPVEENKSNDKNKNTKEKR